MADVDLGGRICALVLVEKAQLRGDSARKREQNAQVQRHRNVNRSSSPAPPAGSLNTSDHQSAALSSSEPRRLAFVHKSHTMSAPEQPPTLLVDVDGVLSLFGFDHVAPPPGFPTLVDGTPHWLSPGAAGHLNRLSRTFECVWCTGWEERAEEHLPRLLGLPGGWTHPSFRSRPEDRAHWKLAAIDAHVGASRPVAWVDDAHDAACAEWAANRPGPTLLVPTSPAVGLTADDVTRLEAWAASL